MISSDEVHLFPDVFMTIKRSLVIHNLFNLQFIIELLVFSWMCGGDCVWCRVLFLGYFWLQLISVVIVIVLLVY